VSGNDTDTATGQVKGVSQKNNQGFIGGVVNWWGLEGDFEGISVWSEYFIA